ncbi:nucleotidyltransferase domain-containing protein [Moraxella osloensis]|uniref:DNA polymerase beta superfamily protein n=1 Tax=Faucicola osloensis TaxID=34062 RepID=UPI002003E2FD|nr:nucleotidyltransferase domain-containing protein [Moraxella osloensis]MCK6157819.1 nucleotidyltransferase domain-containing protein [Moraxella osloensis]MCK6158465.1 nucleotidyltransferase domain-containing protein [Moraxella osloensis]
MSLTIDDLKAQNMILFECISGSRAYGLDTSTSDTDIKGVFYLAKERFYSLQSDYIPQVSNETNDIVYYELGRFVELLLQNNPNMMELLATPADKVLYRHPIMESLKTEWFISKLCEKTFAGFANSQIKKARGLNKKIVNPMDKEKKSLLDFCVVFVDGKSIDLQQWLDKNHLNQRQIGLAVMPHATQMYAMYIDDGEQGFHGIMQKDNATQVSLSSIPKGMTPVGYLSCNLMGYSKYCKDYSEYWEWVENRNEERYQTTISHGKQYDAKNMMHTIRLLQTALDIAKTGKVIVKRLNRHELLAIKAGQSDYKTLVKMADELTIEISRAFRDSNLTDEPNRKKVLEQLVKIRQYLYS